MRRLFLALATLAACGALAFYLWPRHRRPQPVPPQGSEYVAGSACAGCHAEIYRTYMQTGMGRSFSRPESGLFIEDFDRANTFFHGKSQEHYKTYAREGNLYQRRHQIGPAGEVINEFEKKIDYILGSGNHSRTYLYRGAGRRLYQLPVAWYSDRGGFWAMNPGYDRPGHLGFRRVITYDCMFCHNGYPQTPGLRTAGQPEDPVFPENLPEGIDCQRCHGPGRVHIAAAGAGKPAPEIRAAIVNPRRLNRERQLEVCMQCHLETTSNPLPHAIVKFDRPTFSYQPGQPLSSYVLHFDHPPSAGYDDKFEIAHAAYRLRKSACFVKSSSLTCTTCHDPHQARRLPEAAGHYREVCQSCHNPSHRPAEDCTSCHMPKQRTQDVVHVVMTDHFIQREKPARDLTAPMAEKLQTEATAYKGEVVPYYPDTVEELYLAIAQVAEGSNLKNGIPRLEAAIAKHRPVHAGFYFALAEAYWRAREPAKAVLHYRETLRRDPKHRRALQNLGFTLRELGRHVEAADILERAGDDDAGVLATLGDVYLSLGRVADSERVLRKAISLDADNPEAHNNFGQALSRKDDRSGAIAALREAIRIRPDYSAAHNGLANQLLAAGHHDQAHYHFKAALRADPDYASAHYNFGTALAMQGRLDEAEGYLKAAVRLDPKLAEAHNNLGNLYAAKGLHLLAAESFRRALSLTPATGALRLNLAIALANSGQVREAKQELETLTASTDPSLRQSALRLLEQLPQF